MEFFKKFKNMFILTSLIYIVLGIIMLLKPSEVASVIFYIIGGALILYGLIKGASSFSSKNDSIISRFELVFALIAVAAGFFIILRSDIILSIIPFVMGIVLIVDAIDRVRKAAEMKANNFDKWWVFLILGLVLAALGIILMTIPMSIATTIIRVIGAFMIYDGISDLITSEFTLVCIKNRRKQLKLKILLMNRYKSKRALLLYSKALLNFCILRLKINL